MATQLAALALLLLSGQVAQEGANEDKGIIGEYTEDGATVVMKLVNEMPPANVRSRYTWLTVISWPYDGSGQNGMPVASDREGMQRLEHAIEQELVDRDLCVHSYSRTGNNLKELVYYITDRDYFMAGFNKALADHPRYPIEVNFYEDKAWEDLQAILEMFNGSGSEIAQMKADKEMRARLTQLATVFGLLALFVSGPGLPTWSIVAVDPDTREVGSAGASCTGFVAGIVGLAPGHGVIVAQARSNATARKHGVRMLRDGASPDEVIAAVASLEFDPNLAEQQYGVAALAGGGSVAVFTGASTHDWQGHLTGEGVAVQGNILTGPEVLSASLQAFEDNPSLPLAERLLLALEAGAREGGDSRCGEQRALSAYLAVGRPGDPEREPYVKIIVPGQRRGGPNPVQIVRERYDE